LEFLYFNVTNWLSTYNKSNKSFKALDDVVEINNQVDTRYSRYAFADTSHIKDLKFVRYLMNKNFHNQALLKIQELIYDNSSFDHAAKRELYTNYIRCLFALDKLEDAIFEFEVSFPKEIKEDPLVSIEIAICHLQLKNYLKSHQILDGASNSSSDATLKSRITMLKGKAFSQEYKWQEATEHFRLIPKESLYKQQADQNILVLQSAEKIKYKKPVIAGLLSIIPGGGYLYAGHRQTAISAFIINAAFAYATYSSFKNKNYGVATLSGTLSLAFYIGNIQGAVKSAKRYNSIKKQDLSKRVNVNFNY
jgi:hypothetical protein